MLNLYEEMRTCPKVRGTFIVSIQVYVFLPVIKCYDFVLTTSKEVIFFNSLKAFSEF